MPDYATRWFLIAAAIGFPFWIAFAWFYEWTPPCGIGGATVLATLAFLFSGSFERVLKVAAALMVVQYALMFVSVFVLRRSEPDTPRPYRGWGCPWTTGIGLVVSLAFLVGVAIADPLHSSIALGILVASYPLYRGVRRLLGGDAAAEVA